MADISDLLQDRTFALTVGMFVSLILLRCVPIDSRLWFPVARLSLLLLASTGLSGMFLMLGDRKIDWFLVVLIGTISGAIGLSALFAGRQTIVWWFNQLKKHS